MTVAELVRTLAEDHKRGAGIEEALLVSLEDATRGHLSHGRRSGGASSGVPVNGDAIGLADRIRGALIQHLALDGTPIKVLPLPALLTYWHDTWADSYPRPEQHAAWAETLASWEADIRRTIATHERAPVQDGSCPICGQSRFVRGGDETWALLREWDHSDPHGTMRLTCLACQEVLASGSRAVAATLGIDMPAAIAKIASDHVA